MKTLHDTLRWRARIGYQYLRAYWYRRRLSGTRFVGITGSAGKTTTKDLTRLVLSKFAPTSGTTRTANTIDLIPEVVLDTRKNDAYCVIELSASKPNALTLPLWLAKPTVGVVTRIGRDHYSAFRSLEAIAEEKGKLIRALPRDGVAVLNIDDPHVRAIGEKCPCRIIWVGEHEDATFRLLSSSSNWPNPLIIEIEYDHRRYTITTGLHGKHLTLSVLSALGVALAVGVPIEDAIDALRSATPSEARMEVIEASDGVTLVRDDWKATHWALDAPFVFMRDARADRKIMIIGTLSDSHLGPGRLYPRVARQALDIADLVLFTGNRATYAAKARNEENTDRLFAIPDLEEAAGFLQSRLQAGDLVLLKGTNKSDHLIRLMMDRERPVACWKNDCRLTTFCYRCPEAHHTPVDQPISEKSGPSVKSPVFSRYLDAQGFSDSPDLTTTAPNRTSHLHRLHRRLRNHPAYQTALWKSRIIYVYTRAWVNRLRLHRTQFIGITGSAAKTSTKDLAQLILSSFYQVSGTPDSLNVPIAVARTVLNARRSDQYCVVEIGAYKPGAFDQPLRLLNPKIGAVTIIGRDHYRAFKSIEAIAEEKGKLVHALPKHGTAVLNIDDLHVKKMGEKCKCPIIWVGRSEDATIRLLDARSCWPDPLTLIVEHDGQVHQIHTQLHGVHLALPVLTALGISLAAGIPLDKAIPLLWRATPTEGRMQIVTSHDGVVFLRDDKKAPAWSLEPPLEFLRQADAPRKVAIIGTISDFNTKDGPAYRRFAREIRKYADLVVFVGPNAHRALRARTGEDDNSLQGFSSIRDAAEYLRDELKSGDLVLVKGSQKADHLVRLIMNRDRPVQCWRHDCRLDVFCNACDKAYQPTDVARGVRIGPTAPSDADGLTPSSALHLDSVSEGPRLVIVGLGNPDSRYDDTPHNVGYRTLDVIAASQEGTWNRTEYGLVCEIQLDGVPVHLFKPAANMNVTGPIVKDYLALNGVIPSYCLLIHDDMDIPLGKIRLKRDGGDAGHRGVRSVVSALGTDAILRIRIGVRRPGDDAKAIRSVLKPFTMAELAMLEDGLEQALMMARANLPTVRAEAT